MMFALGLDISLMRLFRRKEIAKPMGFAGYGYAGAPFTLKTYYADKPRLVSTVRPSDVLRVSSWINYAKVAKSIIVFVAVYMVDKTFRPLAVRQQPRNTMGLIYFPFIAYSDVRGGKVSRFIADFNRARRSCNPRKAARVRVILKNGTEMLSSNVGHDLNVYPKTTRGQA